ncbi:MAG TPA: hypothetical protein DCP55_00610 [Chitinophagaceae bacterium]|jgi:uncharacterized protein (DUF1501 family)|nr:DUF1501 domain-containing protein [Chitinophagaceae bacterium]HAL94492.1 hypothetical protein [Chitinophagaceae bacterium]
MKRSEFLAGTLPAAALLPELINGYTVKAFDQSSPLVQALMRGNTLTDHVLVIIQLAGGNDGLNMVIPVADYSRYFNARSNIAIPETAVLPIAGVTGTGLNPAMTGLQSLFAEGKAKVVQAVGYPEPNFSHFRATDIWMSASNSTQQVYSGWAGRYLDYEYPNYPIGYPNAAMPDPLAIQIGGLTSLTLQGPVRNMGMSITNPTSFYNLIAGTNDYAPNTRAGKELTYVRNINRQTQGYATVIKNAANSVTVQSPYPTGNTLADQLKIVARLIKGGLKTRVYMVSFGGFDTHSIQVNADKVTGTHATLLGRVSAAIKAFQDDIKFLGVEDRVLGMTFSEFGRRIKSNSSVGTDHGAAAPLFLFGSQVEPGMLGVNPTLPAAATVNDNIPMQYDFRSIYATILEKWFCLDKSVVQSLFPQNVNTQLQTLPLLKAGACSGVTPPPVQITNLEITNFPNPFTSKTTIQFSTTGGHTLIQIFDTLGRLIKVLTDKEYAAGTYRIDFDSDLLPTGLYYARLQNGITQQVRAMMKVR